MNGTQKCVTCGADFVKTGNQKNCSSECSKKYKKQHHKKYRQTSEYKEMKKKYNQLPKVKERARDLQIIRQQTPEFKAKLKKYYHNPEYKEKRRKYYKEHHPKKPPILKNCVMCGDEFTMNTYNQKICSKECSKKMEHQRKQTPEYRMKHYVEKKIIKCVICGLEFKTSHGNQKNCSPKCSNETAKLHRQTPEYKEREKKRHQTPEYKEKSRVYQKQKNLVRLKTIENMDMDVVINESYNYHLNLIIGEKKKLQETK